MKNSALILINLQIDFCTGGAMEVPKGEEVIPVANSLMDHFEHIIAVKDWHPANHISFAGNHPWRHIGGSITIDGIEQILLPFHCVQNTFGAHLHPSLQKEKITFTVEQGTEAETDNDNCFYDVAEKRATGILNYLSENDINRLFFMGLATEDGVKKSVLKALDLDFKTFVIKDGCKAWNKQENEERNALAAIKKAGVVLLDSTDLLARI